MSYCVNCGVKLDSSLKKCPLCNTPVINLSELKNDAVSAPFAAESGQPESVRKKDWGLLLTVVMSTTSLSCGLLNVLVFRDNLWSLLIIGVCILLWVLAIPLFIYSKIPVYVSLLFDGFAVAMYLYMISFITPGIEWLTKLALPITALVTIEAIVFAFLCRRLSSAFLATALYIFIEIPVLCIGIELLVRQYLLISPGLTWSAVVLTVCAIISIILITILSKKRLRNAVRRRLHF